MRSRKRALFRGLQKLVEAKGWNGPLKPKRVGKLLRSHPRVNPERIEWVEFLEKARTHCKLELGKAPEGVVNQIFQAAIEADWDRLHVTADEFGCEVELAPGIIYGEVA